MDENELLDITINIEKKLGKENNALIADEIQNIIQKNNVARSETQKLSEQVVSLKERNEKLTNVNNNLLQHTPLGFEEPKPKKAEEEKPKSISLMSCFDEKGNFKRKI